MPIYTPGSGLEASENAENKFSKSNALGGTTRYASRFHRQQDIVEYWAHADVFDAFANLSECSSYLWDTVTERPLASLLTSKYKHSLEILAMEPKLAEVMDSLGLDSEDRTIFDQWLVQEGDALRKLGKEPPEETLRMEYLRRLEDLQVAE
jgi:hypothetical protein